MSDVPTLQQELERKTLETLQKAVFDYEERRITGEEAYTVIQTVWDVVAGLITKETMEVVSACQRRFTRPLDRKYALVALRSDSGFATIRLIGCKVHVNIARVSRAAVVNGAKETLICSSKIFECESEKDAHEFAREKASALRKNGFVNEFAF